MINIIENKKEELKRPSSDISCDLEEKSIVNKLIETLSTKENGLALAAPQIGIYKKAFVTKTSNGFAYFINPKIEKMENPFIFKNEGCLSFPGLFLDTIRYNDVVFSHKYGSTRVSNIGSVVTQHEIDHLYGKIFFERVPEKYKKCFCGSGVKFKFCCMNKL